MSGAWQLRFAPARPLAALEAVARSAAQTLADSVVRVRQCAGATCSLFFLDATPTGSYLRALYKYPQAAFPYEALREGNRRRTRADPLRAAQC